MASTSTSKAKQPKAKASKPKTAKPKPSRERKKSSARPAVGRELVEEMRTVLLAWDEKAACTGAKNGSESDATGSPVLDALQGDGWLELVHEADRERAQGLVVSVATRVDEAEDGIRLGPRGDRWAVLRAQRHGDGGVSGVLVDASHSLGTTARLARLVENLNQLRKEEDIVRTVLSEGVGLLGGHSSTVHVLDDSCTELVMMGSVGLPPEAVLEAWGRLPVDAQLPGVDAMRTGSPVVIRNLEERHQRYPVMDKAENTEWDPAFAVVPMYRATGDPFGVLGVGFASEEAIDAMDEQFLVEVADQCALALDRARLASVAERNQEQLAFLDALSGALSRSLDVETALTHLAELTVPRLADWCAVRVIESAALPLPAVGVAHRDPTKVELLTHLAERLPRNVVESPLGDALRAAQPFVSEGHKAEDVAAQLGDPRLADAFDSVGSEAVVIFPLHARGRLIGALGFGNAANRPMRPDEFELAHAVAVRAAVLVDNARLFAERSEVARALQDSLLPGVLPDIPGLDLGARYRPAGQGLDVGGDFYDAFQADENWWVFGVGDVCGHGVEAASLTGLARHTIRSAAMSGVMPSAILGHLNRMLLQNTAELEASHSAEVAMMPRFCTVVVGAVQPTRRGVDIIICSGGHPLPLVRRANDAVTPVGVPGTLLGITDDVILTDTVVHLEPGEALVCYTDGLTDRRSGRRSFGEEGVVTAVMHGRSASAAEMAEQLEADAVGFADQEPSDDMAVLVLKAVSSARSLHH